MNVSLLPTQAAPMATEQLQPVPSHRFTYAHGTRLLERYTVQRGIGMGGFGEVYFAISDAGKEVALKQIQRNLEIELRGVSHCLNLKHPNLVAIYDVCRDAQDRWWIVMEYVAGPNLRERLDASAGGFNDAEIRRWFEGIAAGVEHLHQEGLVHRDLKPGNLFDDRGQIKVGDYGLSKFISETRRGGHTESVGTFHYMAPEIARGEYGRAIDIYALGVILYELVTGELPFDGESSHEIIMKHMTATPDLSKVPVVYRHAIAKALEKDAAARWTSVRQMLAAVETGGGNRPETPVMATLAGQPGATGQPAAFAQAGQPGFGGPANAAAASPIWQSPGQGAGQSPRTPVQHIAPEPVARAVSNGIQDFQAWWRNIELSRGQRALLVALVIFALVLNTRWLLPLLSILGIVYVPYYIIRQMLIGTSGPAMSYQEAHRLAVANQTRPKPLSRKRWTQIKRMELASKRASTQLAELAGSWTAACIAAVLAATTAGLFGIRNGNMTTEVLAPYMLIGTSTMACAMSVLALGKLWEAKDGDPLRRRMVMLGIGGGLGALTYAVSSFLMLDLSVGAARAINETELPQALYVSDGTPRLSAYMVHFGLLLAIVRWWRITDPLRRSRLSLWSVVAVAAVDWMIQQLVPIGQPVGMMIAAGTVIATQIGAPWENPRQREWLPAQTQPIELAAKGKYI